MDECLLRTSGLFVAIGIWRERSGGAGSESDFGAVVVGQYRLPGEGLLVN